jgi:hypothetical protein
MLTAVFGFAHKLVSSNFDFIFKLNDIDFILLVFITISILLLINI